MNAVPAKPNDYNVITYRRIRSAIGILGIALPVLLIIFSLIPFFKTKIQFSISHYYYSNLRDIFTGILFAVGLFLIRYKGHSNPQFLKNDNLLTNIAGGLAFGVALFPTNTEDCAKKIYTLIPVCHCVIGTFHYIFAAILFLILAIISINVFTIGQKEDDQIPDSMFNENKIYKACGYFMLFARVLVPILAHFEIYYATLVCEALALFAFGTSWLIKGRALGDKGIIGEKIYREKNL